MHFLQHTVDALTLGSSFALYALGIAVIFGISDSRCRREGQWKCEWSDERNISRHRTRDCPNDRKRQGHFHRDVSNLGRQGALEDRRAR